MIFGGYRFGTGYRAFLLTLAVASSLATLPAFGQSPKVVSSPSCGPQIQPASIPTNAQPDAEVTLTRTWILELRAASFPEMPNSDLQVRTFHSQSDYFRTRFSVSRFLLLRKMRYFVEVNPALFGLQPPFNAVCAVLAHELVHVASLSYGNRIRRLGLVRLLSRGYTARFERRTDLDAIHRGYGDGLKNYRDWVYAHIPPNKLQAKRRNYFSPVEITAIQTRLNERPDSFAYWTKHVPMNLKDILEHPN